MKKRESTPADAADLRARAEHRLEEKSTRSEPNSRADESQRLIHELQVHQIELELQNEQLQEARADLEAALSRYSDLYDFAPVGYLTLDRDGVIQKVNLTGARLLGIDRARLIGARLGTFVSSECRPIFNTLLREVFASRTKEACDVALCPEHCAAVSVWVHIEAVAFNDGGRECRAVLIDISGRKLAEKVRQETEATLRAIYDHLPNPTLVWQHRATGFVLAAFNQAAHAATRGEISNFLGRGAAELPVGIPDLVADIERCFEERVSIRRELDFVSRISQKSGRLVATYGFVPPDMVLLQAEDATEERQVVCTPPTRT